MITSTPASESAPRASLAARREAAHSVPREARCDLAHFVDEQLHHAERELARPVLELHGGIHEARKGLRKARSTLQLAGRGLDAVAGELDRQLGELCERLSTLRDAQSMTETLARLAQEDEPGCATPRAALPFALARRDTLLGDAVTKDPGFAALRERVRAIRLQAAQLNWPHVSGFDVARGIARAEGKVLAAYQQALAHPADQEAWHQLRRRLRRLKHQSALLSGCSPMLEGTHFSEAMLRSLAHAQDEHVLLTACGRHSPFPADIRHSLRALLKRRLRHARKSVRRTYRAPRSAPPSSRHHAAPPHNAQGPDQESVYRTP